MKIAWEFFLFGCGVTTLSYACGLEMPAWLLGPAATVLVFMLIRWIVVSYEKKIQGTAIAGAGVLAVCLTMLLARNSEGQAFGEHSTPSLRAFMTSRPVLVVVGVFFALLAHGYREALQALERQYEELRIMRRDDLNLMSDHHAKLAAANKEPGKN